MTLSVAIAGLGCLLGDSIAALRVPVPGVPPVHWWQ
jgi:hypothetical protein